MTRDTGLFKSDRELIKQLNPNITRITLGGRGLFDENIEEIVALLNTNPYITTIDLSHNNIESCGNELSKLQHITELNLDNCNFSLIKLNSLLPLLHKKQFKILHLNSNLSLKHKCELIADNTQQLELQLEGCSIPYELRDKINQKLKQNKAIDNNFPCNDYILKSISHLLRSASGFFYNNPTTTHTTKKSISSEETKPLGH